jgi:RNA polymerase sigma-70 factor (ECF subfamily)
MNDDDLDSFTSEELATQFARTRENAYFTELVRRHKYRVFATAYGVLGDVGQAEDVAQETFLGLSTSCDRFESGNVAGWLVVVARRFALNLNRGSRQREAVEERFVAETIRASLAADRPDPRVLEILATLPQEQRICLNYFYGEGLSAKEVAEKTRFSAKEVKTHIQNGRRNFKKRWIMGDRRGR